MEKKEKVPADVTKSIDKIKTFIFEDFIENNYTVREGLTIIGCLAGHVIVESSLGVEDFEEYKQCLFNGIESYIYGATSK